ncbi:MAG TPA: helix-turn-helix transcriptional regulator [Solirubrobacteraceae bacterium]
MKIKSYLTDEAVLSELGARLERQRLERNLTQRELATQAGVERKAVQRMESGEPVKLTSFVRVLRALGLVDALEQLVPEPVPSPIELLKLHGKERRRASGTRGRRPPNREKRVESAPWQWGDETETHAGNS